jgi:hypothetical protein
VALGLALEKLVEAGTLKSVPVKDCGGGERGDSRVAPLLDLCYEEDSGLT